MKSKDQLKWDFLSNGILLLFSFAALFPMLLLIAASFSDEAEVMVNGYSLIPAKVSAEAYRYLMYQGALIGRGYLNTILVTLLGTAVSILLTSMFAYALANERLPGGKLLNFLCIFTMLFSGGQVASYYIWSNVFHIRDTIFALILPNMLLSPFNVILVKNYYQNSIPPVLREAARIDGCSEFKIFWKIIMPLSVPINATIGLMTGLIYWNDWVNGLYYLSNRNGSRFYTIQIILNQISENISFLSNAATSSVGVAAVGRFPTTTARMAIAVVGMLPVLIVYPFLQKYFVKGITIGAVKE